VNLSMRKPSDKLLQACRTLFGPEAQLPEGFLAGLQRESAKSAYRSQVKTHHPDHYEKAPLHIRQQQTERFRTILQAYRIIEAFLAERQLPVDGKRGPSTQAQPQPQAAQATRFAQKRNRVPNDGQGSRIPNIPLEFGMFAFYSGKVSYADLTRGLAWQRRQRPAVGAIAIQWGWLTAPQISCVLDHPGPSRRFCRKAVELRFLQPRQAEALLAYQRSRQQPLGRYFVIRGLLNQRDVDDLARRLDLHNTRLRRQSA